MKKLESWLVVLVLAVAGLVSGCGKSRVDEGTVISVIYSADTHGKLEGCGCQKSGGGITRRAAKIKAARDADETVLYVDAGNFMTGAASGGEKADEAIIDAYNQMGLTAVNISERELARGLDAFHEAQEKARFEYVSANVRFDGRAIADPYVLKQVKGANVAIVGLCGTKEVMRTDSSLAPVQMTVENPLTVAKEVLPALAGKADIIIVLSTCGDRVDSLIARDYQMVHLIIGGRSYRPNSAEPWYFGSGFEVANQLTVAEENLRFAKQQNASGFAANSEVAQAQREVDRLRELMADARITCVVRTERDGKNLGRMDMVFGSGKIVKTYSPSTLRIEATDPSNEEMLALVRKYVPDFVDNPTTP